MEYIKKRKENKQTQKEEETNSWSDHFNMLSIENMKKKVTGDVGLSWLWITGGRWLLLRRWIVGDTLKRRRMRRLLLVLIIIRNWSVFLVFYYAAAGHLSFRINKQKQSSSDYGFVLWSDETVKTRFQFCKVIMYLRYARATWLFPWLVWFLYNVTRGEDLLRCIHLFTSQK